MKNKFKIDTNEMEPIDWRAHEFVFVTHTTE